jgi:hypothetical protein
VAAPMPQGRLRPAQAAGQEFSRPLEGGLRLVQAGYRLRSQGADLGWRHGPPRLGQGGGFQGPDLVRAGQPGGAGADCNQPQRQFLAGRHHHAARRCHPPGPARLIRRLTSGPGRVGADQDRLRHLAARAGTRPGHLDSSPAQPQLTNASAVVLQYYQDITDHDWHAAGALGGSNITAQNGQTYDSWVSGLGRRDRLGRLSATRLDGVGQGL